MEVRKSESLKSQGYISDRDRPLLFPSFDLQTFNPLQAEIANALPLVLSCFMRFVGIIPARLASTRLPGKPLIRIAGRTLVEWVYRSVNRARVLEAVWVATDDERVVREVESFGGRALLTRADHPSGTDRVAEASRSIDADVFVNVQGDEPLIAASTIEAVCAAFAEDPDLQVSTACVDLQTEQEYRDPHTVKVVTDLQGRALYFSRAPIPFAKEGLPAASKHLGIYAYRRSFLLDLDSLQRTPLESTESLEQLRFLENGVPIRVVKVPEDSLGIDTNEDLDRVRPLLENPRPESAPQEVI